MNCPHCGADLTQRDLKPDKTVLPLPEPSVLREDAVRTLREIAISGGKEDGPRVAAAKAILDETAPDLREHMLKLMKGDRAKYRAWLTAELEYVDGLEGR